MALIAMLITADEVGSDRDQNGVFYFDLPLVVANTESDKPKPSSAHDNRSLE